MYVSTMELALHREGLLMVINDGVKNTPATHTIYTGGKSISTKQAYEQAVRHGGLGLMLQRDEFGQVIFDTPAMRGTVTWYPVIRSLGVKYSKQSENKDLYGFVKSNGRMIADSMVLTMNAMAANFCVNNAFPGGSSTSPDGQTIFSSSHTNALGQTQSNYGTDVVSSLAVETGIQTVRGQKGERGLPRYYTGGFNLVCAYANEGAATRAVNSDKISGTNANDTNEYVSKGIVKIVSDPFIGIDSAALLDVWMLLPAAKDQNPFAYLSADPFRTTSWYHGDSDSYRFAGHMEGVFICTGWMGTYGCNP